MIDSNRVNISMVNKNNLYHPIYHPMNFLKSKLSFHHPTQVQQPHALLNIVHLYIDPKIHEREFNTIKYLKDKINNGIFK